MCRSMEEHVRVQGHPWSCCTRTASLQGTQTCTSTCSDQAYHASHAAGASGGSNACCLGSGGMIFCACTWHMAGCSHDYVFARLYTRTITRTMSRKCACGRQESKCHNAFLHVPREGSGSPSFMAGSFGPMQPHRSAARLLMLVYAVCTCALQSRVGASCLACISCTLTRSAIR